MNMAKYIHTVNLTLRKSLLRLFIPFYLRLSFFSLFTSRIELVTHSSQCNDELAVIAQRVSQHLDVRVNGAVIAVKVIAPDLFKQLFTGKRNALVAHKVEQQVILLGSEGNGLVVNEHLTA